MNTTIENMQYRYALCPLIENLFTGHVEELELQADFSTEAGTEEPLLLQREVTSVNSPLHEHM